MKRVVVLFALLFAVPAHAHVGSFDVFFDGNAGPYPVFVTVRMPQVIPGVAEIEIRTSASDVSGMTVVPMRLVGPGSEHPPTPDRAQRSSADPQFFTASLWLMEHGTMQVRVSVEGARGTHQLSVPITAVAQRTLKMDKPLGALLFGLMLLLSLSIISIAAAAVREGGLDADVEPSPRARRASRIAIGVAGALVVGVLAFGYWWWSAEARAYERTIQRTWQLDVKREGCTLILPAMQRVMPDHGHEIHLFVVRTPDFDRLAHLHPKRTTRGFEQSLPSLPAGRYALFADVVFESGWPATAVAQIDLPDLTCPALAGDDSMWDGTPNPRVIYEHPDLRAGVAQPLRFKIINTDGSEATDLEPYMAMAGHAAVVRRDLSVFAHLHPSGSIAMPALMLARTPHTMHRDGASLPPRVSFPFGFPSAGAYRVFVQLKRAGRIETAAFDVTVAP